MYRSFCFSADIILWHVVSHLSEMFLLIYKYLDISGDFLKYRLQLHYAMPFEANIFVLYLEDNIHTDTSTNSNTILLITNNLH